MRMRNINGLKLKKRWHKILLGSFLVLLVLVVAALFTVRRIYTQNLRAVDPSANKVIVVAIPSGTSLLEISKSLKSKNIIRADWAFQQYVRSKELTDKLQAGTYRFNTAQDVAAVVNDLVKGKVAVDLFTILPGQRLDQIRQEFIDGGFSPADTDEALDPSNYSNMAALADKPAGATLEGYLYPDSFQKTADTSAATIVAASLNEMSSYLSADIRAAYAKLGFTTYKAITLASIVEREVATQNDRATAAQVFLKRLSSGIPLGSDVTACYGAVIAGVKKDKDNCNNFVSYDSPYNTRLHAGLPPGPISNITKSGINAVAYPTKTDYLYFVAGDDGITYFSNTNEEHEALTAQHCKKLCQ
ncbi:endolytic transglycosylase MltG [soil metagenome]